MMMDSAAPRIITQPKSMSKSEKSLPNDSAQATQAKRWIEEIIDEQLSDTGSSSNSKILNV